MAGVLLPFLKWFIGDQTASPFPLLSCKIRWFLQCTCKCYMLKRMHITADAPLWNILLASIWTHGWPVVIAVGERFYSFWSKMFQRTRGAIPRKDDWLRF